MSVSRHPLCIVVFLLASTAVVDSRLPAQDSVRFDVATTIECDDAEDVSGKSVSAGYRLIHVPVYLSVDVDEKSRKQLTLLRIDIQFLQNKNEIVDYSPGTETFSEIQGPIKIETHSDKNANFGIDLSGSYQMIRGSTKIGIGNNSKTIQRYEKIPQRQVVSATGTLNRRTGVYFKFLPSTQASWDGEKELTLIARVPQDWRAGLVRVRVTASGKRTLLPGVSENVTLAQQTYYVTMVQAGDERAAAIAREFNGLVNRMERWVASGYGHALSVDSLNRWLVRPKLSAGEQQSLKRMEPEIRQTVEQLLQTRRELLAFNSDARVAGRSDEQAKK